MNNGKLATLTTRPIAGRHAGQHLVRVLATCADCSGGGLPNSIRTIDWSAIRKDKSPEKSAQMSKRRVQSSPMNEADGLRPEADGKKCSEPSTVNRKYRLDPYNVCNEISLRQQSTSKFPPLCIPAPSKTFHSTSEFRKYLFQTLLCFFSLSNSASQHITRSSATAEKQRVSCAHTPRLASWPVDWWSRIHAWWFNVQYTEQESHAIAKVTARCALYMGALKIFVGLWLCPRLLLLTC